jgi:hypothetical protein
MRIVWFSRHTPLPKQVEELKRIFGPDTEVIQDPNPFSTADDVVQRFRSMGGEEMVVVAPLSVIDQLLKRGIRPLFAEMDLVKDGGEYDVIANGRMYRFVRFVRITSIEIKKEVV